MIKANESTEKLRPLQKLSLFFFNRPIITAVLCAVLVIFGALSYTTLLKREGFPSIETPFAISQGTYLVNDAEKVDGEVSKPLSEFLLQQDEVDSVLIQSFDNFFVAQVSYKSDISSETVSPKLQSAIQEQNILPDQARNSLEAFKFGFTPRGDNLVISFYSTEGADEDILISKAIQAAELIESKNLEFVESASIINPNEEATNPVTGETKLTKKSFDRFGIRENGQNKFYESVVIGIKSTEDVDSFGLEEQIQLVVDEINSSGDFAGFSARISAADAPQISDQINELQKVLLEALAAILVVGSLIIAVRASIITILSMFAVLSITIGFLFAIGYTINTITLFALILSLALIVDDTIIMIEALDNQRRRLKKAKDAVSMATRKVSRAMIAATLTAGLSFVPLIFVGGIIGDFIRAIPYTIIAALAISLIVALVFIPLFARFVLFNERLNPRKIKPKGTNRFDVKLALAISSPIYWARHSVKKLALVSTLAFFVSFAFIAAGILLFSKVTFNIFPSVKDANQIAITTNYPPGTTIEQAEQISSDIENIASEVVGSEFVRSGYYGEADPESSIFRIDITHYKDREEKSPSIVKRLDERLSNFEEAQVSVAQLDAGPPASAFTARIKSDENREAATRLASDIASFLQNEAKIERLDGSIAEIDKVTPPNPSVYNRSDNQQFISVNASYKDTDTTTLVTLTQTAVEKEFTPERVASYGLDGGALSFDFGQESENQESFATLAIAFPLVMLAIYILLAIEFKSLMQPLIIFMAIPFSLFGITLGLFITNNAFSFFTMMGFFALIGLSIKNTILLVDFANQSRREGMNPVDAIQAALAERFRPLVATSLTAIVSLIPLALTSPFWEGLAVTLMFGLFSSTLLVILVFPYYYLVAEFLRIRTGKAFRKVFKKS